MKLTEGKQDQAEKKSSSFFKREIKQNWFREAKIDLAKIGVTEEDRANRHLDSMSRSFEVSRRQQMINKHIKNPKKKKEVSERIKIFWQKVNALNANIEQRKSIVSHK